jgi:hypothetical protein
MSSSKADGHSHNFQSIFRTKSSYNHFARSFHAYHKHDLNALTHVVTTGLGVWGAIQLAVDCLDNEGYETVLWAILGIYAALIAATTPLVTAIFHTAFVYGCLQLSVVDVLEKYLDMPLESVPWGTGTKGACVIAIVLGYGLQDLIHWLCVEKTLMSSYIYTKPSTLLVHTVWLMPLVIDSVLLRHFFIPKLFVSRNRNLFCKVASKKSVEELREWINQEVPETPVRLFLFLSSLLKCLVVPLGYYVCSASLTDFIFDQHIHTYIHTYLLFY